MSRVANLRGIPAAIALALLLCAGFSACGESEAKRSVDARAEALSFYAKNAPVVALLRPHPPAAVLELNRAAARLPAWQGLRALVLGPLHDAGLGRFRLRSLIRPGAEEIEGIDAAALTIGAATPDDLSAGIPLLVLATNQTDLLSTYMRRTAAGGGLQPRGELDDAQLYEGRTASFAARDGVLVSAPSLGLVRSAIARRDGDKDEQLDDDAVETLFAGLNEGGPLLVYSDLASLREADPGVEGLADQAPWTGKLGETAATVQAEGNTVQIDALSKSTEDLTPSEPPLSADLTPFELSGATITGLISPGPAADLITGVAPISGEGTATSDEVRVHVTVGR
jgi:hypothetical protein